ncbi:MAG: NADH dehydrogenase ubiquinone Fe-S protein 4 [Devosia sp.]
MQVRLSFETLDAAETYARSNGIPYSVQPAHTPTPKRASYPDNFRFDRKTPWTH